MQPNYARILFDLLEVHEVNLAALPPALRLTRAQIRGEASLSRVQLIELLEHAVTHSGRPQLMLEFGDRLNISSHGVIGYALMSSATVREALDLFLHYYKVLVPEAEISLVHSGETLQLQCQIPGLPMTIERHTLESVYSSFCTTARFLLNRPLPGATLYLEYAQPDYVQAYHDVFKFPVHFSSRENCLSLDLDILSWPLATHHPTASGIFRQQCDALLTPLLDDAVTANRVRQILLVRSGRLPELASVARQLRMSDRTLKRRLTAEGTSFRKLADQVRAQLAEQYLNNTGLTVADIAALVGYDDVSNFRTAFRRWFSTTPQNFRALAAKRVLQQSSPT